ncbi:MAG: hypothetical protein ACUVX9_09560 [Anaerolineae bacterium]
MVGNRKLGWRLGVLALLSLLLLPVARSSAQGPNLLQNGGFERPFSASIPGKENCFIADPWVAWYTEGSEKERSEGYLLAPEYKLATRNDYPGNRVRSGELSQQWFHSFGNFRAGVYQVVNNVPVGSRLRFELWGMTWSCDKQEGGLCQGATSGRPSPMHLRIGIDPRGGTNVFDGGIVWSPEQNAYDQWHQFAVEAVAQSSTVTVFVYSYPDYRSQDNNVYVDDASLIILAPPPTPTPPPTNTPLPATATPTPTDTPLPTETPSPTPTPLPTETPVPTDTPAPSPTTAPSATPEPTATATPVPAPSLLDQVSSGPGLLLTAGALVLIIGLGLGIVLRRPRQ